MFRFSEESVRAVWMGFFFAQLEERESGSSRKKRGKPREEGSEGTMMVTKHVVRRFLAGNIPGARGWKTNRQAGYRETR